MGGEPVHLTRKEYAVLALLVQHAGRVVTQPQLLRELWGPTTIDDTHYLRIVVGKLRQKLGDDPAHAALSADRAGRRLPVPRGRTGDLRPERAVHRRLATPAA